MRPLVCSLWAALALVAGLNAATAEDGCGRGRYYNGYRCAPIHSDGHYYGPPREYVLPDHDGRIPVEAYPPGVGPRARGRGDYGPQTNDRRDCYNVNGRHICCPKRWTVQDGVCKPYRGY